MSNPGFTVGRTERVTVRNGLDLLADGSLGMVAGTVIGPLAWGALYERSDDATYAYAQYGTLGVLEHEPATSGGRHHLFDSTESHLGKTPPHSRHRR